MYNKLKTQHIKDYNIIPVEKSFLISILNYIAMNCPFSTFGYVKGYNSTQCLEKTNSGNCVALSLMLIKTLKRYGIKSYLIPASVPKMFAHKDYLDISHVAVCIPYLSYIYVLDPAFYFMEPMVVDLSVQEKTKVINSYNIYSNRITPINYKLVENYGKLNLNKFQTLPKDIFIVECNFVSDPTDIWNYYLVEVKNPDEAISSIFITAKQMPFITALNPDYSIKHLVKFLDEKTVLVKENGNPIFEGEPRKMSLNLLQKLAPYKLDFSLPRHIGYLDFYIK